MFLSDVATAAKQVFILYVLVLLGFICDRTKIYTEKAARLTNDLLFYIVTACHNNSVIFVRRNVR